MTDVAARRLAEAAAWNEYVAEKTGDAAAAELAAAQRDQLATWWASRPVSA